MNYKFKCAECLDDDIIWGQLTDGTYFMGHNFDDFDHTVWFFGKDDNPYLDYLSADDNDGIEDYVETYSIGELDSPDNYQFWEECFAFMEENPSPVYQFDWVEVIDPQYAIYGQLVDGTYFMAGGYRNVSKEEPMVAFTNINPEDFYDLDSDEDSDDWEIAHIIQELPHPENLEFWDALMEYGDNEGLWV